MGDVGAALTADDEKSVSAFALDGLPQPRLERLLKEPGVLE
jgi:hypothetical protein